jgi:trimeric autotransporter adhesin
VTENVPGLEFINQLRPVTYNLDVTGINKFLHPAPLKSRDGKTIAPSPGDATAVTQKEKEIHTGFIAQEVEVIAKKINYDFSGVDAAKSDKDLYSLRYSDFVVPLVKAVQELSKTNDSLTALIDTLQSQVNEIRQQIGNLKKGSTSGIMNDAPVLKQNAPNPFNNNTVINYYIPAGTNNAQIIISDINGQNLANVVIGGKGSGQITVTAGTLVAGDYIYSLIVDGRKVDTKKMVLVK